MSDSVQPHRRQPTGLLRPWGSPGKNTGVSSILEIGKFFPGGIINILGFRLGSAGAINSATIARKQPQTVSEQVGMAVFQ